VAKAVFRLERVKPTAFGRATLEGSADPARSFAGMTLGKPRVPVVQEKPWEATRWPCGIFRGPGGSSGLESDPSARAS
jgi:hypothetical protein